MIPIEDRVFENETVVVDGKFFTRCSFESCTLIFMGGDYGWIECKFGVNVWTLKGAAWRTVQLIKEANLPPEAFK